jgi:hypothetical protein
LANRTSSALLAVLGDSEGRAGQHRVGFERTKGRQYNGTRPASGSHDIGEKIDDADIDVGHSARMLVAQENAQLVHHPRDWTLCIAIDGIEGRTLMGIKKPQPNHPEGTAVAYTLGGTAETAGSRALEIVNFLYEIGSLKRVRRSGWWLTGVLMPESVADHSFRGAVIAFVVAEIEGIDPFRTAVICLFHDLNEIRLLEREFCDNGRPINASAKICALPYK